MIVSTMSRMPRATSFGVFWRAAPSTSAIIRSMKVSPGLLVIRTTIRSERTVVPPVTAQRSPPDSRMTGADSPVIADSSTVATPSTMSPSPGMTWPASTTTRSPRRRSWPLTCSSPPLLSRRRAMVVTRTWRKVAAWALPRPSAIASARLAKRIVTHSQTATRTANVLGSRTASTVVRTAPTHTTKITGWRIRVRGSSLRAAAGRFSQAVRASDGCGAGGWVYLSGTWSVMRVMTVPPRVGREPGTGRRSVRPGAG